MGAAQDDASCPSTDDNLFIASLMQPGAPARRRSPPGSRRRAIGIDNKPGDFEYVKIFEAD